jgi:hypothetical protein
VYDGTGVFEGWSIEAGQVTENVAPVALVLWRTMLRRPGVGGGVVSGALNVAMTVVAADMVTVQEPVPVQPPPLQPVNVEPVAGVAVRVTAVPLA